MVLLIEELVIWMVSLLCMCQNLLKLDDLCADEKCIESSIAFYKKLGIAAKESRYMYIASLLKHQIRNP